MTITYDDNTEPEQPAPDDYPWITAWGRMCSYTEHQIEKISRRARAEHAPSTAIASYFAGSGWLTLDDVVDFDTRKWLLKYSETFDLTIPQEVMDHWLDPHYIPPSDRLPPEDMYQPS